METHKNEFKCSHCGHTLQSEFSSYRSSCPKCGMKGMKPMMKKESIDQLVDKYLIEERN
jgi:Zn finger protein HypA/HybF involved in hydrogenase expression